MKSKLLIVAVIIMGMSACTQKLCPTYAKQDAEKPQVEKTETVTRL